MTQEPDKQTPNHETMKNGIPATTKRTRKHKQLHSDTHTHKKPQVHRTKKTHHNKSRKNNDHTNISKSTY